jgi:hypothetical protein
MHQFQMEQIIFIRKSFANALPFFFFSFLISTTEAQITGNRKQKQKQKQTNN